MLYPVYIYWGNARHPLGVTFPDFPACFSAADDWNGMPAAIRYADEAHFHGEPDAVPPPTPLEKLSADRQYQADIWLLAEIDLTHIDTQPVRLNVSLPSILVLQIDTWASDHHLTRSSFVAKAAVEAICPR